MRSPLPPPLPGRGEGGRTTNLEAQMAKKTFRIELGINLNAATISRTNPNMRLFPLQNALIDVTGGEEAAKPAWYTRLEVDDVLSFRLVDTTHLRNPQAPASYPAVTFLDFFFTAPDSGLPVSPFVESPSSWQISEQLRFRPSPVYSRWPDQELPTWDVFATTPAGKELTSVTLAGIGSGVAFRAFELAVALKTVRDGWTDQFVFDPEMIVNETGG